jgi:hypothetical protein
VVDGEDAGLIPIDMSEDLEDMGEGILEEDIIGTIILYGQQHG